MDNTVGLCRDRLLVCNDYDSRSKIRVNCFQQR